MHKYLSTLKNILLAPKRAINYAQLKRKITQSNLPLKIIIGSGYTNYPGWLATNIHSLNLLDAVSFQKLFGNKKVHRFLAEHVFEHLSYQQGLIALKNCYDFMEKDGAIRIAVPDGYHPNPKYIDMVKPRGYGEGADDHKELYNYKSLSKLLQDSGFKIQLLEYYNENKEFYYVDWNSDDGHILRSRRFDKRFNEDLGYSSLIIEGIK